MARRLATESKGDGMGQMNKLDDLFYKYKADKTPRIKHHYSEVYYELMKDKQLTAKKILEIGTAEGASLFAWRDFFPNAVIFGFEIDPKRVDLFLKEPRLVVYEGDQSNEEDLFNLIERTGPDIDFVIDDGSHIVEHQIYTAKFTIPSLNPGATYIIEDVDTARSERIFEELWNRFPHLSVQMIKVGTRHDDRMIIIRK